MNLKGANIWVKKNLSCNDAKKHPNMVGECRIDKTKYVVSLWFNAKSKILSGYLIKDGIKHELVLFMNGYKTPYNKVPDIDGKALIVDKKYKVSLWRETKFALSGYIKFDDNVKFVKHEEKLEEVKIKEATLLDNLKGLYDVK